ncbi:prepilin peptidase [Virgibacillus necropolis]|uniref:prepilin peptidase n=1 Tax=Virgibacillus necropolis TaxID=163877 RepID=UPI003851599F
MWVFWIISIVMMICVISILKIAPSYTPYKLVNLGINYRSVSLTLILVFFYLNTLFNNCPDCLSIINIFIISLVISAAVFDGWFMVIPDRLLAIFIPSIVFTQIINGEILYGLLGAAFAFTFLLIIAVISKGGIGGGDIKLVTAIGLGTSINFIYELLIFSSILAFIIGIIALTFGMREKREMVPFGPTIAFVTICMLFINF